jgi:hypothetical protein
LHLDIAGTGSDNQRGKAPMINTILEYVQL